MAHITFARRFFTTALLSFFAAVLCCAQSADKSTGAAKLAGLLESSGHAYSKVADGVWQINFTGNNLKQFPVRLAIADEVVVVMAKLADRKDVSMEPAALTKFLELNHSMDSIKIALSEDMLYLRMDARLRQLDSAELKYVLDQVSGATDEAYPQIKQYFGGK